MKHSRPIDPADLSATAKLRFWEHVSTGPGCWEWNDLVSRTGYGMFYFMGRGYRAHRLVYAMLVGDPGTNVLHHTCFNTRCVNPAHLSRTNQFVNRQKLSMGSRGKGASGVRNVYKTPTGWEVRAKAFGVQYQGGHFRTLEEAALAAARLRDRVHGPVPAPDLPVVDFRALLAELRAEAEREVNHCKRGHPRTPGTNCRECARQASTAWAERNRDRLRSKTQCPDCGRTLTVGALSTHRRTKHEEVAA